RYRDEGNQTWKTGTGRSSRRTEARERSRETARKIDQSCSNCSSGRRIRAAGCHGARVASLGEQTRSQRTGFPYLHPALKNRCIVSILDCSRRAVLEQKITPVVERSGSVTVLKQEQNLRNSETMEGKPVQVLEIGDDHMFVLNENALNEILFRNRFRTELCCIGSR
ncbi:uncharacterized protein LOC129760971, partial [Uranotaenia lowii]|uniref:uncharacterized protein LOC129760971 n=1 Tax=Uranotaenia lowii TaxID=190385 RepID=UPI002479955C